MTSLKLLSLTVAVFLTSLPAFADNGNMMSNATPMNGMSSPHKAMNTSKKPKQAKTGQMSGQNASGMSHISGNGTAMNDGMKQAKPASH